MSNNWNRIEDLESQLDIARHGLLARAGWHHTSATPDCIWRWIKQLPDGTKVMTTTADALHIERALEQEPVITDTLND